MEEIWKRMVRCTKDNLASYRGSKPRWKCNFTMTVLTQSFSGQNKNPEAGFLICSLGGFSGARSDARGTRQGQCCRRRLREEGASQLCNCMQDKSGLGRQVVSRKILQ